MRKQPRNWKYKRLVDLFTKQELAMLSEYAKLIRTRFDGFAEHQYGPCSPDELVQETVRLDLLAEIEEMGEKRAQLDAEIMDMTAYLNGASAQYVPTAIQDLDDDEDAVPGQWYRL